MRRGAGSRGPALRATRGLVVLGLGVIASLTGCGAPPQATQPLPEGTRITVRGHREVAVRAGEAIPRFLGGRPVGLCFQVTEAVDTSQWQASLALRWRSGALRRRSSEGEPLSSGPFSEPVARSGSVVCFEAPLPASLASPADLELCARIEDLYDDTTFEVPCSPIRFEPDPGRRAELMREIGAAVGARHQGPLDAFVGRLGSLARSGRDEGFPALASRAELIAVHYILQEGAPSDVRRAERLLESQPEWLHSPAVTSLAADAVFLAGVLKFLRREELEGAWQDFLEAHALYDRVLDRKRLAAVRGQVEVLAQVGLVREGLLRLERALAECEQAPCSPTERTGAVGLESWLTLLDTDASLTELSAAADHLAALLEQARLEPAERANHLINLALLQARQGAPPGTVLTQVEGLFLDAGGSRRTDVLAHWGHMAEALYELSRPEGDLNRARSRCSRLAAEETTPQLTAWAFSCMGRILHRAGKLADAEMAFRKALAFHGHDTPERLGRLLPLGPSHRAEDHYRAARLALDLGDGNRAWSLLTQLDRDRLGSDELLVGHAGYRAFALEDEVLLLYRNRRGQVREIRRTALPRGTLRERTDAIDRSLAERSLSDEDWRDLVRPLAGALRPEDEDLPEKLSSPAGSPPVLTYALHGMLQKVPLAALPLANLPGGDGWLADLAVPAVRPAEARPVRRNAVDPSETAPLVILDPLENLGSRTDLASFYAELFPGSRRLLGSDATVRAFTTRLPTASWLHADTHGSYDPAFPERSSLALADGAITLRELADLPLSLAFANLSGCRTGTWPVSADSGRYGIGGLLARRGARWVIASRSDLLNRLALAFNPVFYRTLSSGSSVPRAYDRALASVRHDFPAVAWASIFLLQGEGETFPADDSLPHEDETARYSSPWR